MGGFVTLGTEEQRESFYKFVLSSPKDDCAEDCETGGLEYHHYYNGFDRDCVCKEMRKDEYGKYDYIQIW